LKTLGEKAEVPTQDIIVRQDTPCGSTIGPLTTGQTGIQTIDVGCPQLAMHSIREFGGRVDAYYYQRFLREFFDSFEGLSTNFKG